MTKNWVVGVLTGCLPIVALALDEVDFYVVMEKCKTTVGYLVQSDESIKILDGTPYTLACQRQSKRVICQLVMADGEESVKGKELQLDVILDSIPDLYLESESSGDFYAIHLTNHSAVGITRSLGELFAGSKVCQGVFLTGDEMKLLTEQNGE